MKKSFIVCCLVVAMAAVMAIPSLAEAQSSKAAWMYKELIGLSTNIGPTNDTGWVTVLTSYIKTPNGKELAIGASLQCGLVTDTTVRSKGGDLDSSAARGKIVVRIKITQPDGSIDYAEPDNGADLSNDIAMVTDGVTYCDRYQRLEARFAGLNCTADPTTHVVTCADPEELRLLLQTLSANHFNFIFANAKPGVQKVEVQARALAGKLLGGSELGDASAEAFVGAGALSVETIRLVKDADGTAPIDIN